MAARLDRIVVVDIEATCWEGEPPPGQVREIIEVGVCVLNVGTLERGERVSLLVRPTRSEVSPFCTTLTTLTADQVAAGRPFTETCAEIGKRFSARERCWASWGDFDRKVFAEQCDRESVPYPFGPTHLNVKTLHGLAHSLPHEIGMMAAIAQTSRKHDGTHHRGHDDAWNIAGLLAAILAAARGWPSDRGGI